MDEIVAASESSRRFNTTILTSFAAIALLLSLLGIYGVLAYSVTERTREIAIRMALGATRETVLLRTLRYALSLTAIGAAIGLAAVNGPDPPAHQPALRREVTGRPGDARRDYPALPLHIAIAGWLPARRAASVDPMRALRTD